MQYGDNFIQFAGSIKQYCRIHGHQNLICWTLPLLRAELWYVPRKLQPQYLQRFVRSKLCSRSRWRYLIFYQKTESTRIIPRHMRGSSPLDVGVV